MRFKAPDCQRDCLLGHLSAAVFRASRLGLGLGDEVLLDLLD